MLSGLRSRGGTEQLIVQPGVAWVSFVVGVHFLPLAALFRVQLFAWHGARAQPDLAAEA